VERACPADYRSGKLLLEALRIVELNAKLLQFKRWEDIASPGGSPNILSI